MTSPPSSGWAGRRWRAGPAWTSSRRSSSWGSSREHGPETRRAAQGGRGGARQAHGETPVAFPELRGVRRAGRVVHAVALHERPIRRGRRRGQGGRRRDPGRPLGGPGTTPHPDPPRRGGGGPRGGPLGGPGRGRRGVAGEGGRERHRACAPGLGGDPGRLVAAGR